MYATDRVIRSVFAGLPACRPAGLGRKRTLSTQAMAADGATEKCAGVAKAGKNDCGTTKLS